MNTSTRILYVLGFFSCKHLISKREWNDSCLHQHNKEDLEKLSGSCIQQLNKGNQPLDLNLQKPCPTDTLLSQPFPLNSILDYKGIHCL